VKSFGQFIREEGEASVPNSTGILSYGLGFKVDVVRTDFDVEDFTNRDDPLQKNIPWEVENALKANQRRGEVLKWLKKAGANTKKSVDTKSLPKTPKWQTTKR